MEAMVLLQELAILENSVRLCIVTWTQLWMKLAPQAIDGILGNDGTARSQHQALELIDNKYCYLPTWLILELGTF